MICHSRATRITHLYSRNRTSPLFGTDPSVSQRFNRGNVAIIPQDVAALRPLLPPPRHEIQDAMCALFVGTDVIPTRANIAKLSPILVSRNRVATLLDFLLANNPYYKEAVEFSQTNLDDLLDPADEEAGEGVPRGVELCCLPHESGLTAATEGYAQRGVPAGEPLETPDVQAEVDIIMEAVGYTAGDRSPLDYQNMKAAALAWCLDKKKFIKMQSGSKFISERDIGMLTYTFPHLDPWGIGGFKEPMRSSAQQALTFERQVRNLLLRDDTSFQQDPNFAYVCWNIMQKKEVIREVCFRTPAATQQTIAKEVQDVGPALNDLMQKWEKNPHAKPSSAAEKKALKVLNKLKLVAKNLKGSSGYKQCRRNEIR
ncbi:hypothetical protein C8R44DRAFT_544496, partial [Mycena epipterygia]